MLFDEFKADEIKMWLYYEEIALHNSLTVFLGLSNIVHTAINLIMVSIHSHT